MLLAKPGPAQTEQKPFQPNLFLTKIISPDWLGLGMPLAKPGPAQIEQKPFRPNLFLTQVISPDWLGLGMALAKPGPAQTEQKPCRPNLFQTQVISLAWVELERVFLQLCFSWFVGSWIGSRRCLHGVHGFIFHGFCYPTLHSVAVRRLHWNMQHALL